MPGGRPAVPTPLKVLHGNPGKRALNREEPKPEAGRPEIPDWLGDTARGAWTELCDLLEPIGIVTKADGKALEMLCDAYAEYRDARAAIKARGMSYQSVTEGGGKIIRAYPEVGIASDAWRRVRSLLGELGLTPASRVKLKTGEGVPEDPLEEFLKRGGKNA